MGGKLLFAGDRLLGAAGSSSGSDHLDFGEDDIWAAGTPSPAAAAGRRSGGGWKAGGRSAAAEEEAAARRRRTAAEAAKSAPVSVPEWRKVGGSEEEEEEEEWVPPHEYVARVHGRRAVATSVLEGAGRTLKGRDMSRVRDAVWSRTGFFG